MTGAAEMTDKYFTLLKDHGVVTSAVWAKRQLEDVFGGVDLANKRMLDIGGGNGTYSFYAACRGARDVVCLEPAADGSSAQNISFFETLRRGLPEAPVRLDTRLIQEYTVDDGQFDVVFMHASINHIDEAACTTLLRDPSSWERYKRVLRHVSKLSAPGARLIVCDCSRYNFFASIGVKNPLVPVIEWEKHHKPEVWAKLLQETGFRDPKITWEPLYRFGRMGRLFFANRVAAYFLKSIFCLKMTKA
jgi:SAM-dependent methyltransferase